MERMKISIPEPLKEFIHQRVSEGGYSSTSEYMWALIRADQKRVAQDVLEAELLKGLQSGESTSMTPEDWECLHSKVRRRHGAGIHQ